jgi:hypothetical protein
MTERTISITAHFADVAEGLDYVLVYYSDGWVEAFVNGIFVEALVL